ncbi:TraK domain-containing protein, partial [Vibrio mediterranei]
MRPLFFKPIKRWPATLAVLMLILILAGTTKLAHATEHTISEHVRGAKSYTLSDNDTVQVTLSGVDLNRLVVSGDVITNVHCP